MKRRRWLFTVPFLGLGAFLAMRSIPTQKPTELGYSGNRFEPCPSDKRNCVCSTDQDERFNVAPINCKQSPQATFDRLKRLLEEWEGYEVVTKTDSYLHVEFTSRWMRFTDDLEFQLVADQGVIHVRSASRIGYSDLGANRDRVEKIRQHLAAEI